MRELILMRHAEAMPQSIDGTDFSRPLTRSGSAAATAAALALVRQHGTPDWVLHSAAVRTTETAAAVRTALQLKERALHADQRAYQASANRLLQLISEAPEGARRVLLVAHNPGVSELSSVLGTDGTRAAAMATAEFRHFRLPILKWRELHKPE